MPDMQHVLEKQTQIKSPLVRVGLLGLGTVGTGVYKLLSRLPHVQVTRIAVQDTQKVRDLPDLNPKMLTEDVDHILNDPDIDLVVELMGGKDYPYQVIKKALAQQKHVVTANKVVIAHYGKELFELAHENHVNLLFEAAVAGGIPIILPLKTSLAGNQIQKIAGILNGTTNYILTRMEKAGLDFDSALKEAQAKGFAEADPTADVDGHDAACKIGILSNIAYQADLPQDGFYTEGIRGLDAMDMAMAETLGYVIKLIALSQYTQDNRVDVRVHPMLVPSVHPLAKISDENNAIWLHGDAVGDVMFYGKGAGELPTASAVVGDILLIAQAMASGQGRLAGLDFSGMTAQPLCPISDTTNAYYVRLETTDQPGVIGALGTACGDHQVSLNALLQKGTDSQAQSATIVLLTHHVKEANMQAALKAIAAQPTTREIHTVLRVFTP